MDGWLISFRAEQQQRDRKLMGGNGGDFKERGRKPTNLWPSHCHTTIFETPSGTSNVVTAFRYDASRNGRLRLRLRLRLWLEHSPGLTSANGNKQQISWMAVWKKNASLEGITASQITGLFLCTQKIAMTITGHSSTTTVTYFKRFQSRRSWCVWLFFLFDMGWEQLLDTSASWVSVVVVVVVLPTLCRIFLCLEKNCGDGISWSLFKYPTPSPPTGWSNHDQGWFLNHWFFRWGRGVGWPANNFSS